MVLSLSSPQVSWPGQPHGGNWDEEVISFSCWHHQRGHVAAGSAVLLSFYMPKKKPPKPGRTLTFLSCVLVADSVSKMSFGHVDSEMSLLRPLPASDSKVFSSGLKIALDSITNRFPFSCAETRKQLLLAAVEIPPKKEISECTASLAAVDAAVAVV